MNKEKLKERLIDLLWHDAENQYYEFCELEGIDKSIYAFSIDQLTELFHNVSPVEKN